MNDHIDKPLHWRVSVPMKTGDTLEIAGFYKRRTFWQWITRKPRELQKYVITHEGGALLRI